MADQNKLSKYFLSSSESGDYYLIKADHRDEWEEWRLDGEVTPEWAVYIDGFPDYFEFDFSDKEFKKLKERNDE